MDPDMYEALMLLVSRNEVTVQTSKGFLSITRRGKGFEVVEFSPDWRITRHRLVDEFELRRLLGVGRDG